MDTLVRTQLSLYKSQRQKANQEATGDNISMAEVVRRALNTYFRLQDQSREERRALAERLAGSWKNAPNWKNVDAVKYQQQLRREQGV